MVRRWALPGNPHGIALGSDGTVYVGLAQTQEVVAIDPATGAVKQRVVLDSGEVAATKELVTLRTNRAATRLYIANGNDDSATILSLPDLRIVREIPVDGEPIRDALPDPDGRFLLLLGNRVHVYDSSGNAELRRLDFDDPMAIALSASASMLAVVGPQQFGSTTATVVALYDTSKFEEIARDPLQTDKRIEAALFAGGDRVLMALAGDTLYEKPLAHRDEVMSAAADGRMRMSINFGDLVNSERICLPLKSGPEVAVLAAPQTLFFAERRCSSGGAFAGSPRVVAFGSLYGVDAFGLAFDREKNQIYATGDGSLTIYRAPKTSTGR